VTQWLRRVNFGLEVVRVDVRQNRRVRVRYRCGQAGPCREARGHLRCTNLGHKTESSMRHVDVAPPATRRRLFTLG
jgi:hypothetical protein